MAVVLAMRFPWGRYHATPWGRYVNEGAVELPPSPWRLLRALYSVWQLRAPDLDAEVVGGLLARLAVPPSYLIPPYRIAHSRHYYPDTKHRAGKASTDKAMDAFAVLDGDQAIYAIWPGELDPEQSDALARLARSIPYIGRADSTCEVELLPAVPPDAYSHGRAEPVGLDGEELGDGHEPAEVLCPVLPLDLTALVLRPVDVRAGKLLYPPSTRKITYAVPVPSRVSRPARRTAERTSVVRLAVSGVVQPPMAHAVPLMDALRGACIKVLTRRAEAFDSLLAGKSADGRPLADGHRHAHFLPYDGDGDGRIDEVIVWAPGGLTPREVDALNTVARREIGVPNGVTGPRDLTMLLTACGQEDLLPNEWHRPAERHWTSVTPFVPSRHRKPRQEPAEYLQQEVIRELGYRGEQFPQLVVTARNPGSEFVGFVRRRWRDRKAAGSPSGYRIDLEFTEPVEGPIVLGHLSHFGLGLFAAAV
ncbi:type I-U CRISPR-associated protein Csb2 [Microbispora sp. GKU 823]|uniref:type I-G CRISPR-associated protein Csb2 n=1 Tax=Microbispora sp. GKU 823 TaxID=1652100 RepID=UPI0009A29E03|nr:type I-U CRISPR-associated protein Csb2 [Microbispora sp. GKU 823]OPG09289.1 type I-U CRISPR-associated protein Cas5/Cas6 [Microbispora sp. GKU 823]